MKKENNKISCHSRVFLSGISTVCEQRKWRRSSNPAGRPTFEDDPRRSLAGKVRSGLYPSPVAAEGRMGGFTLIELLIAVLIIGVLVAVAVPQYQRTLEKNQAALAITLLQEVYRAEQFYYLNHGTYTKDWDALDIHIPGVASTKKWWEHGESARSVLNGEWVLEWMWWYGNRIVLGRIKGPHAGGAFVIQLDPQKNPLSVGQIYCAQKTCCGTVYKNSGYCDKIFKGTYVWSDGGSKYWSL